jgi:uncharacterized 2Fe-2S/4Fe-4S cluster protein (DUF4445 family)
MRLRQRKFAGLFIIEFTLRIRLQNSSVICNAASGETILSALARSGFVLSAPCGGRQSCGKCRVRLLEGQVTGDRPDADGTVLACLAAVVSDISIALPEVSIPAETVESKSYSGPCVAAIDIGTTTVSAKLIDPYTSQVLDVISELNDQRVFGADVMSRITAAKNGKTNELFTLINRQTDRILKSFLQGLEIKKIEKLAVSGNTVMLHLFLNVDPSSMGELPFTPVFLGEREVKGEALSLPVEDIIVLPGISAFIGGDISAGLAVIDILNSPGPSLLLDIGTNGEMALCYNGAILCCSTAAGPAFEGAEISCGTGGIMGAISRVELDTSAGGNNVLVTSIGNAPPIGICGCGLIDAVAVMLKLGIINETGAMAEPEKCFNLSAGISISAADIRQFQLAKSAIHSGIRILCKNLNLHPGEIKNVYIAGGLGFFIDKQNAVATGIFPQEFLNSISVCGNLSLDGAVQSLCTKDFLNRCRQIISKCSVIDLGADPAFMDEFAGNMLFKANNIHGED